MDNEYLEKIKKNIRTKQVIKKKLTIPKYVSKVLIVVVLTLTTLIALKANPKLKATFYNKVYDSNFSFAELNKMYEKYFGSSIPFKDVFSFLETEKTVFNENLTYSNSEDYKDGVKLIVGSDYLIPSLETGLVVFVGEKEDYGNTVIIEQQNGIDVWYCNLKDVSVKLYDYVTSGSYIGNNKDDFIYLLFKKEGEVLDYKEYI